MPKKSFRRFLKSSIPSYHQKTWRFLKKIPSYRPISSIFFGDFFPMFHQTKISHHLAIPLGQGSVQQLGFSSQSPSTPKAPKALAKCQTRRIAASRARTHPVCLDVFWLRTRTLMCKLSWLLADEISPTYQFTQSILWLPILLPSLLDKAFAPCNCLYLHLNILPILNSSHPM